MSVQNKAIIQRYIDEVLNQGSLPAARALVAREVVFHNPGEAEPVKGFEQFLALIGRLRTAFPDLTFAEQSLLADGDQVAARWVASGTQRGEYAGQAPTGRRFQITGISIYRIDQGQIVEGWLNDDGLGMFQQLGLSLPAPVSS